MKGLANFVMRGRLQASGVAALTSALPIFGWLGTSVVALVILRQGIKEGLLVFLWAALPLIVIYQTGGDVSGLAALVGTFVLASVLRATTSWELTLVAALIAATLGSFIFSVLSEPILSAFVEWYVSTIATLAEEAGVAGISFDEGRRQAMSYLAMGQGYLMILAVMLARWWQSHLFNPGGFKQEVQGLRLSPKVCVPLIGLMVLCALTDGYAAWVGLLAMPFVVAGSGLVHWFFAHKKVPSQWYFVYYMLLMLMFQWVSTLLVMLVFADGALDLRRRIESKED